jgi:hypothetical protein
MQYAGTNPHVCHVCCVLPPRLGPQGVQACAVDPGAVRSNIWANNPNFNRGPGKAVIDACYAPPEDAARVLLHAATCDWQADAPGGPGQGAAAVVPERDLRYYARGVFAWPQVGGDTCVAVSEHSMIIKCGASAQLAGISMQLDVTRYPLAGSCML